MLWDQAFLCIGRRRMTREEDSPRIRGTGGCLCGAVRYEVRGPLRPVVDCHCTMCRRTSGHFAAFTATRPEDLVLTESKDYAGTNRRRRLDEGSVKFADLACSGSPTPASGFLSLLARWTYR